MKKMIVFEAFAGYGGAHFALKKFNIPQAFIIIFKVYFQNIFDVKSTITINNMFLFK